MACIREKHPDVDFYLLSGDIVQSGTAEEYTQFREYMHRLMGKKPCYATVGNHDTANFWQGWFGTDGNGSFDYTIVGEQSGLTIIALDSRGGNVLGIFTGHTHIRFESMLGDIPCHTAPSITFGLIVDGHSMTATDDTGYNYCEYSNGVITVTNINIPGTGARDMV